MRFRVEAEGGTLQLRSTPGAGTMVEASLPASAPAPP
jgi:signal transduction histidine kinase